MPSDAIIGGVTIPVRIVTDADLLQNGGSFVVVGRKAIPVNMSIALDNGVRSGDAIYVYQVSNAQIASGEFSLIGGPQRQMVDVALAGIDSGYVGTHKAIPVHVESGTPGGGRYFYVDATGGDDGNDGLSIVAPLQTITAVNALDLIPGDHVCFKRGETWTGTKLSIVHSGAIRWPIVFQDYGNGAKPIIDGNDTVDCIATNGHDFITFLNIRVIQGLNFGFTISSSSNVALTNCEADGCGNDNILIDGSDNVIVSNADSRNAYNRAGGLITCLEIIDGSHDVAVVGGSFIGSVQAGISVHSHVGEIFPYNVTIRNVASTGNGWRGMNVSKQDASVDTDRNINILDSDFSSNSQDNIFVQSSGGEDIVGLTFNNCIAYNATQRPLNIFTGGGGTFINCEFHGTWQSRCDGALSVVFYNCVFYRVASIAFDIQTSITSLLVRNCIFYTEGTSIIVISITSGIDINYNLYFCEGADPVTGNVYKWGADPTVNWANWKTNSSQDANSTTPADPLFTDQDNNDYTLGALSPAINAGVDVGLPYNGSAPDCGANETE